MVLMLQCVSLFLMEANFRVGRKGLRGCVQYVASELWPELCTVLSALLIFVSITATASLARNASMEVSFDARQTWYDVSRAATISSLLSRPQRVMSLDAW